MPELSNKLKWLLATAAFALGVAPTFISYRPYVFRWDDSGYLQMAINVNHALWSHSMHGIAHLHQIVAATYGFRPPLMALLGLPWGTLTSWDAAGKCFLALAILISLVSASCLFFLVRMGVKPEFLALASVCACAALGPWPAGSSANQVATAFLADSLFAWIILAALLLIPYEARTWNLSKRHAFLRGIFWGLALSAGAMTKISFLYFVALILPVLVIIMLRQSGLRSVRAALIGFACTSAPAAAYLVRHGRASIENGKLSSFGNVADFYHVSFWQFVDDSLRHSRGLVFFLICVAVALGYLVIRRRSSLRSADFVAILIVSGFGIFVLASVNRQLRYSFPFILALPFLFAVILSGKQSQLSRKWAALAAAIVFCSFILAALPTRYRAERRESLARSDAVLDQAIKCGGRNILLATDSPTLNEPQLNLSNEVTGSISSIDVHAVVYSAMDGIPIDRDFHAMQGADEVVFQNDDALSPLFTNQRVVDYRRYIQKQSDYVPIKVWNDVTVYSKHCFL